MFGFRALFWFAVVCTVVPFEHFDLATGDIKVDRDKLVTRLSSLPTYCQDHAEVCKQARVVLARVAADGATAARQIVAVAQSHSNAI